MNKTKVLFGSDYYPNKSKFKNYTGIVQDGHTIIYHENGLVYREDGPAVIFWHGSKKYYQNDHCHRLGGPAVSNPDGICYYHIHGKQVSKKEHDFYVDLLKLKNLI